ncbi:hypothetical protein V8Z69_18300 [Microbacterium aurugineum]|uniref:hypothetical protein n=1 Tax=Microbacterium aurugineum TaxID=2851642 RepID=UPI0039BEBC6A
MATPDYDRSHDFDMVFEVTPGAWSPRPAVYAQAVQAAESTGSLVPSPQQVYRALALRGFTTSKRRGIIGFRDLSAPTDSPAPSAPRTGTASAYRNRGDRSPEAIAAAAQRRTLKRLRYLREGDPERPDPKPLRADLSPWFIELPDPRD